MSMPGKQGTGIRCGLRGLAAMLAALCCSGVLASEGQGSSALQLNGFVAQAWFHTSENRFYGDSEQGSFDFLEAGLLGSYRASERLLFSASLLTRRAGDMYDGSPQIDYALADISLFESSTGSHGIRLGRVKNPLGFYNETRDVAFTRPSIFLPNQIYFDAVRNHVLSADGLQLYGNWYGPYGNTRAVFGIGRSHRDTNVEIAYLSNDWPGVLEPDTPLLLARLEHESPGGRWRAALSAARADLDYDAAAGDPIASGSVGVDYWIASLQYNAEHLTITAEYMEEPADYRDFGPALPDRQLAIQGYYLQLGYHLNPQLELLLRYTEGFANKNDRNGREFGAGVGNRAIASSLYQKDWLFGLRWDITPRVMLRAEYQLADGTWGLAGRENPDPTALGREWNLFAALLAFRF